MSDINEDDILVNVGEARGMTPDPTAGQVMASLSAIVGEVDEIGDGEEMDDGSIFYADEEDDEYGEEAEVDEDHFRNLLEGADEAFMSAVKADAVDLLTKIEADKEARKPRDKQYEEGLKRTGLGEPAPGGADFKGASRVTHPMLIQVATEFTADVSRELLPPEGPVNFKANDGQMDEERERAERKKIHMNLQLTQEIEEFYDEMEQMISQLPFGGSQYIKVWPDPALRRTAVAFTPIDKVFIPEAATSFYTAERITHEIDLTEDQYQAKISAGGWLDTETVATMSLEETGPEQASDKIEGVESGAENTDKERRFFEVNLRLQYNDDERPLPYLLVIDDRGTPVSLRRNWLPDDKAQERLHWIIDFTMLPWRGAVGLGFPHLIGGLAGAATGALRSLLDAGLASSVPTGLAMKGSKLTGQDAPFQIGQINEVEGPKGLPPTAKVTDLVSPVPFNPPSPVIFQLLGFLTEQGGLTANIATEKLQEARNTGPVGTTLAIIEQGSRVYRSIHARLHRSMARLLEMLHTINAYWLDEEALRERFGDGIEVTIDDYRGPMDLTPVSDPNIFSDTQRIAQGQAIEQLRQVYPQLINPVASLRMQLEVLKIPNPDKLLAIPREPRKMDALQENMHAARVEAQMPGDRPPSMLQAYDDQDHMEHFQMHLLYLTNPALGLNSLAQGQAATMLLPHMMQHINMLYHQMMQQGIQAMQRGMMPPQAQPVPPPPQPQPPQPGMPPEQAQQMMQQQMQQYQMMIQQSKADALQIGQMRAATPMVAVAQFVGRKLNEMFAPMMQTMSQMQQQVQQMMQQQAIMSNPQLAVQSQANQALMADVQQKAQATQAKTQTEMAKIQAAGQRDQADFGLRQQDMVFQQQMDSQELQLKAQGMQMNFQTEMAKAQQGYAVNAQKMQADLEKMAADLRRQAADLDLEVQKFNAGLREGEMDRSVEMFKRQQDAAMKAADLEARERMNASDNATAMEIAAAELETEARTAMRDGTGINPNPTPGD